MKYLLTCLIVGCLTGSACSAEREMTIQEFVKKLEKLSPLERENVEAQLGVKFTKTSSRGADIGYTAYEPLPSVKDLNIQYISLETSNKARSLDVYFDSKLNCLTLAQVEELFPNGYVDSEDMNPGGGLLYIHKRPWGKLVFDFDSWRKEKSCLVNILVGTKRSE